MGKILLEQVLWPALGITLVIVGSVLMWHQETLTFLAVVIVGLVMISPDRATQVIRLLRDFMAPSRPSEPSSDKEALINENRSVAGFGEAPPAPDEWSKRLRPVLYQASYYSVPTYYLNTNLHFIDWNIAFEVVFGESLGKFRNRHVNYFIAELENTQEVFEHARDFTAKVERGHLPLVDMEPLVYKSGRYGRVVFVKVAAQLHDAAGELQGWAVALLVREIDWPGFQNDLLARLEQDKLWSLYAASYDRVLLEFPPYRDLIRNIIAGIPSAGRTVADLGAGTGNVTTALLEARHRVTAVENNIAMLDRLRSKHFDPSRVTVVKSSVEDLSLLDDASFDAAVMMNVLYAVDDPLACLHAVSRILKPGGFLGLTTTHSGTRLEPLLNAIKGELRAAGKYTKLEEDYERLRSLNEHIQVTIACRHTADDYERWVKAAGFEVLKREPAYLDAVILIHARKTGPVS